jgi:hypothetical protein
MWRHSVIELLRFRPTHDNVGSADRIRARHELRAERQTAVRSPCRGCPGDPAASAQTPCAGCSSPGSRLPPIGISAAFAVSLLIDVNRAGEITAAVGRVLSVDGCWDRCVAEGGVHAGCSKPLVHGGYAGGAVAEVVVDPPHQ